jgi:isoprenylcysteine carboxyl methyltransferase (ICMT) family protein YpbQ
MNEAVLKNVFNSLDIMWRGMLGLFVVCGGIAVLMIVISKLIKYKNTKTNRDEA